MDEQMAARTSRYGKGRWHLVCMEAAYGATHDRHISECGQYFLDPVERNPHTEAKNIHPEERCTRCKGWPEYINNEGGQ